jgi:Uma2 family endonuclease
MSIRAPVSVPQYHAMIEAGVVEDGGPVELLEGWVTQKMAKKPAHRVATRRVRQALEPLLPARCFLELQEPVTLGDSEPEPDLAVIRGSPADYEQRHPGATEAALVIEVSDATLDRDRTLKARLYARARITTYWIVNLVDRQIEVYTDPSGPTEPAAYRQRQDFAPGTQVPIVLDGVEVGKLNVADVLP